jgi:membrane-associated phospholipid phosphatase
MAKGTGVEERAAGFPPETNRMSMKRLLCRSILALLVCAILVSVAFFLIDRPVAFFVHDQRINHYVFLKWLTYIPEVLVALAPVVLVLCAVQMAAFPLARFQKVCFAASVSIMVTAAFLLSLKGVFGRYWPETWIDKNPSLIQNGAYGFHFLHYGSAYDSFPSGHTARTLSVLSIFWIAYPRWGWVSALVSASVVVGLVGMNYHFVGDTIGGAFLGSIIGVYCSHFSGIVAGKAKCAKLKSEDAPGGGTDRT